MRMQGPFHTRSALDDDHPYIGAVNGPLSFDQLGQLWREHQIGPATFALWPVSIEWQTSVILGIYWVAGYRVSAGASGGSR